MLYLAHISRFVMFFIFFYSFVTKLRDFAAFERAIQNFQLVPQIFYRPAAITFMLGEAFIVLGTLLGRNWMLLSFTLAIVLLALFIYALNSVLQRKIHTSCNCFGTTERKISHYDVWRNLGIVFVAVLGVLAFIFDKTSPGFLGLCFCVMIALVFSLLLLNLREILEVIYDN